MAHVLPFPCGSVWVSGNTRGVSTILLARWRTRWVTLNYYLHMLAEAGISVCWPTSGC